ncbi:MAG: hypothetical protein U9Q99_00060 [Nanoarchaeota archaeon]|nr:hypothetical protein [Nanoarchaeota archaeon]
MNKYLEGTKEKNILREVEEAIIEYERRIESLVYMKDELGRILK